MILGYARVSTAEQAADGTTSIAQQKRKNKAIASLRGAATFDYCDYVDAGISGTIPLDERPAGHEMLKAAQKGDVVVANKLDRLFRSASDALVTAEVLKKRGIDLILIDMGVEPVTGNGVSKMFFGMLALVAEFERERIADRMHEGRRGKLARNGHIGGSAPYGYRVIGKGREARVEPNQEELDVAKLIVNMVKKRPMREVLHEIADMGIRSRTGKPFQFVQVRRIVQRQQRVTS